MKQWFDIHKKEREGLLYENGAGEKLLVILIYSYKHFSEVMVKVNDI